jgi:hypothetical protein
VLQGQATVPARMRRGKPPASGTATVLGSRVWGGADGEPRRGGVVDARRAVGEHWWGVLVARDGRIWLRPSSTRRAKLGEGTTT